MISKRLKMLREAKKISMRQVAQDLEMPYTTYVHYEDGTNEPRISVLVKFSAYYGISVDWLIGNDGIQKDSPPESRWEALEKMLEALSDKELKEVWSFVKFLHWQKSQRNQD